MKFSDVKYIRPDLTILGEEILTHLEVFKAAEDAQKQNEIISLINEKRKFYDTMENICYIRHSVNTVDVVYDRENDFFNEAGPEFFAVVKKFYETILNSKFIDELKILRPIQFFNLAKVSLKTINEEVIEDLQNENKLVSEYEKLIASAKISFLDKELTLAELGPYMTDSNRDIRRDAHEAYFGFFKENEEKLDDIYDKLVHLRHKIALKLGYDNFINLAYDRMSRTDYTAKEVKVFREAVHKFITPVSNKLMERQKERIGVNKLMYYDNKYTFNTGNPKPNGKETQIVENAKKMYKELSEETNKFFNLMVESEMMDLTAKKGKAAGGYCTYIQGEKMPFVFSNFNGTFGDVTVLTHEVGHAFQVYNGRGYNEPEFIWPTTEAAEIFSMGMEFITWPWMNLFFGEDDNKFKFMHMQNSLTFIPYGVAVDEFQCKVYENPDLTPKERKTLWREIEKKYMPYIDYGDNEYLAQGGFWQKQGHIYEVPFYYIDYTLAQIAAFEIYNKFESNRESAWQDYINMCKVAGSEPFIKLLEKGKLSNPFDIKVIKNIISKVEKQIDKFDDSKF
ncbi:MAG: M3 family oligoendopeptidase [Clostridiales bacterium]|nr:M3 family oligoendopeptidase [Clostridiales bacterium]